MKQVLILVLLVLIGTSNYAQIDSSLQMAQVISYWKLNETQSYSIHFSQQEITGNDTVKTIDIQSIVEITVIDSTSNSFTIKWHYQSVEPTPNSPASASIAQFLNNQEITFETNELGVFKKVINPKHFTQNRDSFVAQYEKEFSEDLNENCYFNNYFTEKQGIGIQELQTIHQFHNFHGLAYQLNEVLEGRLKEAEKVNTVAIPGTIKVELEGLYPERKSFVVRSTKALNSEVFEQAMTSTTSTESLTGKYSNQTMTLSVMHVSGWVLLSNQLKTVTLPEKKIIEERVIKMIE